jgi:hypothetical protein
MWRSNPSSTMSQIFPISIRRANAHHASALGKTGLAVPIHAISDGGVDTIGTAAQLDMSEAIVRRRSAPGFFDFQRHRFAERLEGRLDLIEARGMVEPEQTVDGFSIPAETAHQLGAGDAALPQRAV